MYDEFASVIRRMRRHDIAAPTSISAPVYRSESAIESPTEGSSVAAAVDLSDPPVSALSNYQISRLSNYQISRISRFARGFTLVELLVVLTLIMVLSTIGMAQYQRSQTFAREAVLKEDLFHLRDAIDQYYADKNQYPSSLDALVSEGYIRRIPEDPFTKSNTTWQTVPAEPDPNNPAAETGIYDVKSGSDHSALDGTPYSEW